MHNPDFQDKIDPLRRSRRKSARPDTNIWQRLSKVMEMVIYVLVVLIVAKQFSPELERQEALQRELENLTSVRDQKVEEVSRLRREHANLSSDRLYLEAVARDRLNLQREGEFVIQIER